MSAIPAGPVSEDLYTSSSALKAKEESGQSDKVSKDEFLELLVAQMTHQDPLNPMDNSEFMSQMAQLQALEEQIQTNEHLEGIRLEGQVSSGAAMIGTYVKGMTDSNWAVEGIVTSASVRDGIASVNLDNGESVPLSSITRVDALVMEEG